MSRIAAVVAGLMLACACWSNAETTVTLEKTHLCCPKCVKSVATVVGTIPNVTAKCDQKAGTVTITAPDEATAQKTIDALVDAGFYGKVSAGTIKDDSGAPAGIVKTLTITTHNCCKKCAGAIDKIVKSVPGATSEAEPAKDTLTVTGDFDAGKLVEAFNEAGFSVKVSK